MKGCKRRDGIGYRRGEDMGWGMGEGRVWYPMVVESRVAFYASRML